ncbi:protein phosphatase 1 regulatory subunit 15B [Nothobranchius furzeri]|uniref:Protein phosphatase 1 regulatory subunit 15B-like n=1 Tax=Nothobranchius furzeri TaxID=105023 RepID=A0A8C6NP71_NOTFU|nr:protein phosphatase 1 regulatory subunit 15B-like [Nothobranchius furzeri]
MFRNINAEECTCGGKRSSHPPGPAVTSVGQDSQDSSWIRLLSRPALLLRRKLRQWNIAPAELRSSLMSEESETLRQLNGMMPLSQSAPAHLTHLQCQHEGATGLLESWVSRSAASLRDCQSPGEMELCQQIPSVYVSSVGTFFTQVQLISQEHIGGKVCVPGSFPVMGGSTGKGGPWWRGSILWGEESPARGLLSGYYRPEEGAETYYLCPQAAAQTHVAEKSSVLEVTKGENAGPPHHKEPANNGGLHTVQNIGSCSEGGHPSPEQDNGYFSLEEELSQRGLLSQVKAPTEEQNREDPRTPEMEAEPQEEQATSNVDNCGGVMMLSAPQCQNKSIAFIIGCPCSDDSSQSESSDDDDDDGFDSEGSSDLSDSSDDDDDEEDGEASDSDSEPDSESNRLWTSLCQSVDPYNPRNFTALLHTSSTLPQTIPKSTLTCSPLSSPVSSLSLTSTSPPVLTPSSPPPSSQDTWDDSTSASEVDEAESLRLLSSFACFSDPYSPFNFQAPLRTRGPIGPPSKAKVRPSTVPQTLPHVPHHSPASSLEAEERLDSGLSEALPSTKTQSGRCSKKVQFCDDVEEFFASCGEEEEDRRGPWEELARDRCRFLRRCEEVEKNISYCLQPHHRRQVLQRLLSDT